MQWRSTEGYWQEMGARSRELDKIVLIGGALRAAVDYNRLMMINGATAICRSPSPIISIHSLQNAFKSSRDATWVAATTTAILWHPLYQ